MLDIIEFIWYFLQKNPYKKPPKMSFIHFMFLKLIKTTKKCLICWNLLGVFMKKVLIKNSKFILYSLYFLKIFQNHPKMFTSFEFIR